MTGRQPPPPPSRPNRKPLEAPFALQPGAVIAGKVRLVSMLRTGGMGSVWRAHHLALDVPVAVKFLVHAWAAADTLTRFAREAKAAAQIRSSNVVQVLDHGVDRGAPYIIMELLEGEDLAMRLRRDRRLSLAEVAHVVRNVARGLQIAHDAGLVHRDLKPENIFLAREGDAVVPKILDFGVAKQLPRTSTPAGDATGEGVLLGTPYYMSPEQARGRENIDHRTDLWALGVTAYRCCVGRKPFDATAIGDVIVQICSDPIPPATSLASDLPPAIDEFFARALARDRDQRFQSARELAQAFNAIAGYTGVVSGEYAQPSLPASLPLSIHPTPPSAGGLHLSLQSWGDAETARRAASASRVWLWVGAGAVVLVAILSWGMGRLSATDDPPQSAVTSELATPAVAVEQDAETAAVPDTSSTTTTSASARPTPAPQPAASAEPPPSGGGKKKKKRDVGY